MGKKTWPAILGVAPQIAVCCLLPLIRSDKCWPRFCLSPAVDMLCVFIIAFTSLLTGLQAFRRFMAGDLTRRKSFRPVVKNDMDSPLPPVGHFMVVGSVAEGKPLPMAVCVPLLGLCM